MDNNKISYLDRLLTAVKTGDAQATDKLLTAREKIGSVKKLLKSNLLTSSPADVTDSFGITPLHWACVNGHVSVVNTLLEHGASVQPANNVGDTPLHWASLGGHKEILVLLIRKGADIFCRNKAGRTVLEVAADDETVGAIEVAWHNRQQKKLMWDRVAEEAEREQNEKKSSKGNFVASMFRSKQNKEGPASPASPASPPPVQRSTSAQKLTAEERAQTMPRRNSNAHKFVTQLYKLDGQCCVCRKPFDVNIKNNRCSECGSVCHFECMPFVTGTCRRPIARDFATSMDLSALAGGGDRSMKKSQSMPLLPDPLVDENLVADDDEDLNLEDDELDSIGPLPQRSLDPKTLSNRVERAMSMVEDQVRTLPIPLTPSTSGSTLGETETEPFPSFSSSSSSTPPTKTMSLAFPSLSSSPLLSGNYRNRNDEDDDILRGGEQFSVTDRRNSYLWTPLMQACRQGKFDVVTKLLNNGADIESKTDIGSNMLMAACISGNINLVELILLKAPHQLYAKNIDGRTARDLALMKGKHEVVSYLNSFLESDGKATSSRRQFSSSSTDLKSSPPVSVRASAAPSTSSSPKASPSSPSSSSSPPPTASLPQPRAMSVAVASKPAPMISAATSSASAPSLIKATPLSPRLIQAKTTALVTEVVVGVKELLSMAAVSDENGCVQAISKIVIAMRAIIDEMNSLASPDVVQSTQVMIHLLSDLVKIVRAYEFQQMRPAAMLLVNELKNVLLLSQNIESKSS